MTNINVNINYNNGSPSIAQSGPLALRQNDTMQLLLQGFPQGSQIAAVSFFANKVDANGKDAKDQGTPRGTWVRVGGGPPVEGYTVAANGNNVTITDTEAPTTDDKFWYGVHISGPNGQDWYQDPELINKSRG